MSLEGALSRDRIVGWVVSTAQLERVIQDLSDVWQSNLHTDADGRIGWYRLLNRADRVGNFATAQAIVALEASGTAVPQLADVVRGLLAARLPGGGWAFMSTLTEVDVVDTTAWVLIALSEYRHEPALAELQLPVVLDDVAEKLAGWQLPRGGWGLAAGSQFRAYSTALAVRALCVAGRERSAAVQQGITALLGSVDPTSGAWRDSSGRISIPVTAEVIRALREPIGSRQRNALVADKAARWLLSVATSSGLWSSGPYAGATEEIEIGAGANLRRVEFSFAPRIAAVTALLYSGRELEPAVVHAVAEILAGQQAGDWSRVAGASRHELTSWLLHDVCVATSALRDRLPEPTGEVWANGRRVVVHNAGENALVRFVRRRWVGLSLLAASVAVAGLLRLGGVVDGLGLAAVAFVAATVALGILTNLASEYLVGSRQ